MGKKKLRIGIIGTGGIAHAHANAYKQFDDVEIVAGADIIPGKARKFLDEFGWTEATAYENHEELCARDDIDAVSVCTYNSQHAAPTICALTSGKDVMLEKPMCVTLDEAKAIRAVEKATGHFVTVGFQPRYGANVKKVREVISSGALGKVYYVVVGGGRVKGIPGRTFIERTRLPLVQLATSDATDLTSRSTPSDIRSRSQFPQSSSHTSERTPQSTPRQTASQLTTTSP